MDSRINDILKKLAKLPDGVRVFMVINRSVGNSNKGSRRRVKQFIADNREEEQKALEILLPVMEGLRGDQRLYCSVNTRKVANAIKLFKHRQVDQSHDEHDFLKHGFENYISCLMRPEARQSKLFLLDIDPDNYTQGQMLLSKIDFLISSRVKVITQYATKKGFHIITEPFNPEWLGKQVNVELKKDALALLAWKQDK